MNDQKRTLAAVMVTDIVGYTTMAQRDERLALELLEQHRSLLRSEFARHQGRELKSMGDGLLVAFSSAVEATACAVDIQQALHARNAELSEEHRVLVRIGIHVGDLVEQGDDLLGDAMNVASRIEPLARPGGVCVTAQVYEHVWNKFRLPFVSMGRVELKHVSAPVEVYRVVFPWEEHPELPADRKRVAVLPLSNVSPNPGDAYFADGMTGELIYTLSRIPSIRVIAQTSAMKYRDSGKSVAEIARELNVGTVIEGSVRKAGEKLRITLQVVDGQTEEHLWSEAYDRSLEDVFTLQAEVAQQVANVLQVELLGDTKAQACPHRTPDIDAYMLYLQGRHFWNRRSEEGVRRAAELFRQAIEIDGCYAAAYAGLADAYAIMVNWGYATKKEALEEARKGAEKALALDPDLAEAHASLGLVLMEESDDIAGGEEAFRKAIALNPSYAPAHHWLALVLRSSGRPDEALEQIMKALRLDPLSPTIATVAGDYLYHAGRHDEALAQWRRALEIAPEFIPARVWLANAQEATGDWEAAQAELQRALASDPHSPLARAAYGEYLLAVGRTEEAQAELRQAAAHTTAPFASHRFGLALVLAGAEGQARALHKAIDEQGDTWPGVRLASALADAQAGQGLSAVKTLEELDRRYSQKFPELAAELTAYRALVEAMTGRNRQARAGLERLEGMDEAFLSYTLTGLVHLWLEEAEQGFARLTEAVGRREPLVRLAKALPLPAWTREDARYQELLKALNLSGE